MPKAKGKPRKRAPQMTLKVSTKWREWLAGLAKHSRTTSAGVIDRAVAEFASRVGFRPPPAR